MKMKSAALTLFLALAVLPIQARAQEGQKEGQDKSGATSTIKTQDSDLTLEDVLRRKASGIEVGQDGSGNPTIRIRGAGTQYGNAEPLLIVDGMRVNNLAAELRNLDPHTIDKVRVLRDVASTSIYGTQGANGVIIITTKKND